MDSSLSRGYSDIDTGDYSCGVADDDFKCVVGTSTTHLFPHKYYLWIDVGISE